MLEIIVGNGLTNLAILKSQGAKWRVRCENIYHDPFNLVGLQSNGYNQSRRLHLDRSVPMGRRGRARSDTDSACLECLGIIKLHRRICLGNSRWSRDKRASINRYPFNLRYRLIELMDSCQYQEGCSFMIHCSQKLGIHAAIIFMTLLSASVVAENMHDNRTYLVTGNRVVFGHGIDAKQLAQEEQVQLPANRYKLLHDGEDVLDTKTNLIWRRCAEGMRLQQHHCIGKPNGNGQSLEGFVSSLPVRETLWRMPTTDELMSLVFILAPSPSTESQSTIIKWPSAPTKEGSPLKRAPAWL